MEQMIIYISKNKWIPFSKISKCSWVKLEDRDPETEDAYCIKITMTGDVAEDHVVMFKTKDEAKAAMHDLEMAIRMKHQVCHIYPGREENNFVDKLTKRITVLLTMRDKALAIVEEAISYWESPEAPSKNNHPNYINEGRDLIKMIENVENWNE